MQTRGFGFIGAFLVVGLLAIVVYAAWRGRTSEPQAQQSEPVQEQSASRAVDDDRVRELLGALTLEQKVAQLFVVTPEDLTGVEQAIKAGDATRDAIATHPVGGVCYAGTNLVDRKQTTEMLRNTKNYVVDVCGLVPFLCVEEEGGSEVCVAGNAAFGVTNVGDMGEIGAKGDASEARLAANAVGTYLRELGFNVDLAPVADIAESNDASLAKRAFGTTPDAVAPMVAAQVEGFSHAGVLCAAKHFPGNGAAEGDSHNSRIYSHKTGDELRAWELVPFEAAIKAEVPMIMVGNLSCLELGRGEGDLPASLSPSVIDGLLRGELGYDGLVITDSLRSGGIDQVCAAKEQGVRAIKAGADLVLVPSDFKQAYDGLLAAVRDGTIAESRIDESLQRIIRAKLLISS